MNKKRKRMLLNQKRNAKKKRERKHSLYKVLKSKKAFKFR